MANYTEENEKDYTFTVKFTVEILGENSRQEAEEWLMSNVFDRIQEYPFEIEEG